MDKLNQMRIIAELTESIQEHMLNQIPKYLNNTPKPFTKECYALAQSFIDDDRIPEGFLGYIDVSYLDDEGFIEPLSK